MPLQHPHVRAGIMHPPFWPQNGSFAQSSLLWPESCHRAAENAAASLAQSAQIKALLQQAFIALAMARCTSRSVTDAGVRPSLSSLLPSGLAVSVREERLLRDRANFLRCAVAAIAAQNG
jgi:hypothetical protein